MKTFIKYQEINKTNAKWPRAFTNYPMFPIK